VIGRARLTVGSWSTFGQTALLIVAALLLAQVFTFFVMRSVIDEWRVTSVVEPALSRFAGVAVTLARTPPERRVSVLQAAQGADGRFWLAPEMRALPQQRERAFENNLAAELTKRAVGSSSVLVFHREFGDRHGLPFARPPKPDGFGARPFENPPPGRFDGPPPDHRGGDVLIAAHLADGQWLVAAFRAARPFPMVLNPLFLSQIALFVILLGATLFWASRISRPLRILAEAAQTLQPQDGFEPIPVEGPREVRVAISSFNAMARRVRDLITEKDRMLTAIGHDLRTPLASLRIRAESVEPEAEREKFVETIDNMTAVVEEILSLVRLGYSTEPKQLVDLSALADSVVEEFRALGKDVTFVDAPRTTLTLQVNSVRRLLRNLIDNAVKYGGQTEVSLQNRAGAVALVVEDHGPGIPEARLGEVLQPFTRLDTSRSRLTGGTGLGLSIADAIAKSQGAGLVLSNRKTGGLSAVVTWPATACPACECVGSIPLAGSPAVRQDASRAARRRVPGLWQWRL
jgi:signal transduction histidine kinase